MGDAAFLRHEPCPLYVSRTHWLAKLAVANCIHYGPDNVNAASIWLEAYWDDLREWEQGYMIRDLKKILADEEKLKALAESGMQWEFSIAHLRRVFSEISQRRKRE